MFDSLLAEPKSKLPVNDLLPLLLIHSMWALVYVGRAKGVEGLLSFYAFGQGRADL